MLAELLDRDPVAVRAEAERRFERLRRGRPIVVHGAGGMGRDLLRALTAAGLDVLCVSDRAAGPSSEPIAGTPLLSAADATQRFGEEALFVVAIFNPGCGYQDAASELQELGAAETCPWTTAAWAHAADLLPRYAADWPDLPIPARGEIERCLELFDEDRSLKELESQLIWRLTGDYSVLGPHDPLSDQYFPDDLIAISADDVFVDCGAFDGDTLIALAAHTGGTVRHVYALEPDEANLALLSETVAGLPVAIRSAVEVVPWAAASAPGTANWGGSGGGAGIRDDGGTRVELHPIDELLGLGPAPTYIKMDIEGAEPDALRGCVRSLERRPILAVCIYHEQSHLWELPLQVASMVHGDYRFFVRRYQADSFDLVLYAVPAERVVAG